MLTDIHCHPYYLAGVFPQAEQERVHLSVIAAASACDMEEFCFCENLAKKNSCKSSALLPCFAVHPQQLIKESGNRETEILNFLASEKRIAAVGECGFDLYNAAFRETEAIQDRIFASHLEIAVKYELPVILHVRRAMHKIFAFIKTLKKCKAVVFHSCPCTFEEGQALLRRGVNVYFSFGNIIINNHKQARRSCALFPEERLLTETDAPYQPRFKEKFSRWADLPLILETAFSLRREEGYKKSVKDFKDQVESNFRKVFTLPVR